MQIDQPGHRRAMTACAVIAVALALALALGVSYGSGNQLTYLLAPLQRAHPELYTRDWLVSSTTQYHPVFSWLTAPLYGLDPGGAIAFGVAQLVVMAATFALLYRCVAALAGEARLAMWLLLVGMLALGGGHAIAGTYLFAGYLQPSSLATLAWIAALLAWLRERHLWAGAWLALGGVVHLNFLVLGIGLFAALELSARRAEPFGLPRLLRLALVIGPSLLVIAAFLPSVIAGGHAREPETALRVLVTFHAPGHYDPVRTSKWLVPLLAWLAVAWGALPRVREAAAAARLWRFAVIATALCVAATLVASIPPWLGVTRLFVWRIAPFAQLGCELIAIVAALTAGPLGARRRLAVAAGAVVLIVEAVRLTGGQYTYASALGLVAATALAARWLPSRAPAIALAVVTAAVPLVQQRAALLEPPLFETECGGPDCALVRWAERDTPRDAVFLVAPYMNYFRLFARRAIVADTKSPPLYPDELVAWYRRLCAMVDATDAPTHQAVEARWDTLDAAQVLAVARRFTADYIVLDKERSPLRLALPTAFESAERIAYRVPP